jgi:hypothetical protein
MPAAAPAAAPTAAGVGLPPDALKLRGEMRLLASRLQEMTAMCARLQQVIRSKGVGSELRVGDQSMRSVMSMLSGRARCHVCMWPCF